MWTAQRGLSCILWFGVVLTRSITNDILGTAIKYYLRKFYGYELHMNYAGLLKMKRWTTGFHNSSWLSLLTWIVIDFTMKYWQGTGCRVLTTTWTKLHLKCVPVMKILVIVTLPHAFINTASRDPTALGNLRVCTIKQTVALGPQAKYIDWTTATFRGNFSANFCG
jgi:hypothetical protein